MLLRDLDDKNADCNVIILQTTSEKLRMFVQDNIKRRFKCNADTIISCNSKKDYKQIKDIINVVPPFSEKWYVNVDLDVCNDKDFIALVKEATTCVFFCNVKKYAVYKKFKEDIKQISGVFDYYITYLRRNDFIYLYDAFVPESKRLQKSLFDYVVQSYSGDIEAVFDLFLELGQGKEIKSRKDIADICGLGGNSTESFIISMLKEPPTTEKGLNKVLKNRIRAGTELSEAYGLSSFYNRLRSTLMSFIQIKELLISGVVYKQIYKLPDGYDERRLSKYQRYIWKLKEIPFSRILRLYTSLGDKTWRSDIEFLNFVYRYILVEEKNNISTNRD